MPQENDQLNLDQRLQALDGAALTPLVCQALHSEQATLLNWHYQPLEGGFGGAYGVYRFQGEAQTAAERLAWSLILKIIGPETGSSDLAAWNYWQREVLVYQSGVLDDLPDGLAAPRCFGVVEQPGSEFWLWLEDVAETGEMVWPLARYELAASHLGEFNGAYLVGHPLPDLPWLSSGQLQERLRLAEPGVSQLPHLSQNPLFVGLMPDDCLERVLKLWDNRQPLLAMLNRLPRTLCHHDAFRRNLMARTDQAGRTQTVALDWATLGTGVIGEEIVALLATTLNFDTIDIAQIPQLDAAIFAGYVAGLRTAGWQGNAQWARFGYTAIASLIDGVASPAIKWSSVAQRAAALPPGADPPRLLGPSREQRGAFRRYLLDLGDEAQALLSVLA